MTIKVGIFGRAVAGPKGEGDTVTIPIKIVVARYKEAALATERFTHPWISRRAAPPSSPR